MTMRLIQHVELSTSAANIELTGIPANFDDLIVFFSIRSALGPSFQFDDMGFRINGDTGSNYTRRVVRSREGAFVSFGGAADFIELYEASAAGATANAFGNGMIYLPGYSGSTVKTVSLDGFSESNNASQVQGGIVAALWNNTAAINSLRLYSRNGQNLIAASSATVYGITRGSSNGVTVS